MTLEGLFELTLRSSRALDSPRALLPELQRYQDTVRCVALGVDLGQKQTNSEFVLVADLFFPDPPPPPPPLVNKLVEIPLEPVCPFVPSPTGFPESAEKQRNDC